MNVNKIKIGVYEKHIFSKIIDTLVFGVLLSLQKWKIQAKIYTNLK